MGNTNSAQQQREVERQHNNDQNLAINNFNDRVNSYPHHGNYEQYIEYCRAQYELDCIPEFCRRGSAYNR